MSHPASSHPRASRAGSWLHEWSAFWLTTPGRRAHLLALLCSLWLAFFASQWLRVSKDVAGGRRAMGVTAETVYLPPAPVLRMASLGNQSFLADLVFMRATRYFVDHLLTDSQLPWIELYLDAVWALDAHNRTTYRWGSQVVKFGQAIDAPVAHRANRFARLGIEHFPDDPWLYHEIAYNLHYTLAAREPERQTEHDTLAARYMEVAFSFPSFQYDPNYLVVQYSRVGDVDQSIRAALLTYAGAQEDQRRELRFMLQRQNRAATAAELAWYERVRNRDWPYLAATLIPFVGPKRVTAPPLEPWRPEAWHAEAPTDPELVRNLDFRAVLLPPSERLNADEHFSDELALPPPGAATPSQTEAADGDATP